MPAEDLSNGTTLHHVYNSGVEKRAIFSDASDYDAFKAFLGDYLTPPGDPESTKKVFTVNGKTFKGTPHLPKNYYGKIELVAFSLMPDHFHLILNQKEPNSLESFIRSLCTRYSMYYNKKQNRTGSLFAGPYKSVQVDKTQLLPLISFIHHNKNTNSSYPEYTGNGTMPWVRTDMVTPLADGFNPGDNFGELPPGITLENNAKPLERIASAQTAISQPQSTRAPRRIPEVSVMFGTFVLLVGLGLRNINASSPGSVADPLPTPSNVLSEAVGPIVSPPEVVEPTAPPPEPTKVVKVPDGAPNINIRQEPSLESAIIGKAVGGDEFEFVSENSGWYEIKLGANETGFVMTEFTVLDNTIY
ncbi:MAG TPA: SH3 domain-containing protein [Patescibacteria group bacterium]|nr:SH3 domain-containing protein [Patescibacteria group bacterium]